MVPDIGQWIILLVVCIAIIAILIYFFVKTILPCTRRNITPIKQFQTYLANKGMFYSTSTGCVAAENEEAIKWTISNTSSKSIMMGIVSGDSASACSNNNVVSNILDPGDKDSWIKTFENVVSDSSSELTTSTYRCLYPRCTASFYIANSPDNYTLAKDFDLESIAEQISPGSTIHFTIVDNDDSIDIKYEV